jgi:hypothetical protein
MKHLLLFILSISSLFAYSDSSDLNATILLKNKRKVNPNIHFPIMGDSASTVGHFQFNFDKMPGGQATDSVVMNALSLGLGSRVELGLIPWVYSNGNDSFLKYGITLKYNFYKGKEIQWAIGGSQIKGQFKETTYEKDENGNGPDYRVKFDQWWNYQFVSVNYTPVDEKYNLGVTLKYTEIVSKSFVNGHYNTSLNGTNVAYPVSSANDDSHYQSTLTVDMNYQLKSHNWVGLAVGTASINSRLNISDEVDEENGHTSRVRSLVGASYIYRKKMNFLDTPRVSVVYFEGEGFLFGFSTLL